MWTYRQQKTDTDRIQCLRARGLTATVRGKKQNEWDKDRLHENILLRKREILVEIFHYYKAMCK